jgi:host factor-I protein
VKLCLAPAAKLLVTDQSSSRRQAAGSPPWQETRSKIGGKRRRSPKTRSRKATQNQQDRLMAGEKAQNLQDTFLNHVRKTKTSVTIFLVNGVKLQGFVSWFDNFCLLLRRDGHSQLVYKHAISTIMPAHPIQMFEAGDETAGAEKS